MNASSLHRGYIALISTPVLSFMLTTLAILAGESGLRARLNTTDLENRQIATHAARSCASIALLLAAQDSTYAIYGNEEFVFSENLICVINALETKGADIAVETTGKAGDSLVKVHIESKFSSTSAVSITQYFEI